MEKKVILKARAKINWTLDVGQKRPDGYHEIETIMQSINLWDTVVLQEAEKGISLESNVRNIPLDSRNIAWKAAEMVKEKFDIDRGIRISIRKNIPVSAGLAGGSANAAAVLVGLNYLWNLGMTKEEMKDLGKALGADVPFCLQGGSALAKGIGEKLTPIKIGRPIWLLVVNPPIRVSTRQIFKLWDELPAVSFRRPDSAKMISALSNGDIRGVGKAMVNVLEAVTTSLYPQILDIKRRLIDLGALNSLMSGSGPSVYGVFEDKLKAKKAAQLMKGYGRRVFVVDSSRKGIELLGES